MDYTRIFPQNEGHERARLFLATCMPDTVDDIKSFMDTYSPSQVHQLLSGLRNDNSGIGAPNAIYSRSYVPQFANFYYVMLGYNAIQTAKLKTMQMGDDDYKDVLTSLYDMPGDMAKSMAGGIETLDVMSSSSTYQKKKWFSRIIPTLAEYVRSAANWTAGFLNLPWHNDQTQEYDIDSLYELRLLGEAVERLNARLSLMRSQASISRAFGLNWATMAQGGDISLDMLPIIASLFRKPLGKGVMQGHSAGENIGRRASLEAVKSYEDEGGDIENLVSVGDVAEEGDWEQGDGEMGDLPLALLAASKGTGAAKRLYAMMKDRIQGEDHHADVRSQLRGALGDPAIDALEAGDLEGFLGEIGDIYETETSGDPIEDGEIESEEGDMPEQGGLFMKLRTKMKKRKAKRRKKRAWKRAELNQARDEANADYNAQAEEEMGRRHQNDPSNVYTAEALQQQGVDGDASANYYAAGGGYDDNGVPQPTPYTGI